MIVNPGVVEIVARRKSIFSRKLERTQKRERGESRGSGSVGSGRVATMRKNEGKSTPCHQVGTKRARYDEMYLDNLTLRVA